MSREWQQAGAIARIEANYHNLTAAEQSAADWFLSHPQTADLSAKSIAKTLGVSEPTLSRFAKKCGYAGYRQFVYDFMQADVKKPENITRASLQVLESYQDLLSRTYSLMDENQAAKIVEWMARASRVFICGLGSSGIAAQECAMRFMRIGIDITCLQERDVMRMHSVFTNTNQTVIGCSISGTTRDVLDYLQRAHANGAKTVLITSANRALFAEFCDEVLLVPSLEHLNYGDSISPQFPLLVMMDLLFACAQNMDLETSTRLHKSTLQALD
jgi:DNA-binding MurR/RpiR family transcriptional regulator